MLNRGLGAFVIMVCICVSAVPSYAQSIHTEDEDCAVTDKGLPENIRAIAHDLNVCEELRELVEVSHTRKAGPTAAVKPNAEPPLIQMDIAAEQTHSQELEAHQKISEAATRATLDSNLLQSQVQNVILNYQNSVLVDEKTAYRRTKLLNAFLGATVGAIGTGLQFSSSDRVQHIGDGVGVGGGVATVIFALCTADVYVTDSPPDQLFEVFENRNQDRIIPDDVWNYVKDDGTLMKAMDDAAKTPPKKKVLSCHFKGAPKDKREEREAALGLLNKKLTLMNRDVVSLLNAVPTP